MASEEGNIIYLEKDRLFFYNGEKLYKLDLTPQDVRDIDVLNEDSLITSIFQFIDSSKLTPSGFLFILSESVLFTNETTQTDPAKLAAEFQTFIDLVPFDFVLAKQYKTEKGIRMVATNAELIDVISDSFAQKGFTKDGVFPAMIYGQYGVRRGLDSDTANYMLRNQNLVKGKSMLEAVATTPGPTENVFKVTAGQNKILPYLISGFVLALLGLLALIFFTR